jgi:anti-sigma regulatory factor (Ser/Thr protein kinase)
MPRLRLPANVAHLPDAARFVAAAAAQAGLDAAAQAAAQLALEEAFVNVCRYAYRGPEAAEPAADPPGDVELRCAPQAGALHLELADQGVPFDPLAQPAPDFGLPIEQRVVGGAGIPLIRAMADAVAYRREGPRNVLRMTFRNAADRTP